MSRCKELRGFFRWMLALTVSLVLDTSPLVPATQQQQTNQPQQSAQTQSPPTPSQTATKQRKIWTNDEVVSLRSPADTYLLEKEAQEAAATHAAAREKAISKELKQAGLTLKLPPTKEKSQELIETKQGQIHDLQDGINRLNKDLPGAAPDQKPGMQKQIEILQNDIEKEELEIKALQDHIQDLSGGKPSDLSAAPPVLHAPPNPQ